MLYTRLYNIIIKNNTFTLLITVLNMLETKQVPHPAHILFLQLYGHLLMKFEF